MKLPNFVSTIAAFCAAAQCWGQGTLVVGHFGAADPTSEGFSLLQAGNPSLAPVLNDLGLDTWHIGLDTDSDIGHYTRYLTAEEQASLESGWVLSLTLRVLEPFGAPTVGISAGANSAFRFGAQSDGDPILRLGNSEYNLDGAGSGYHNYQLGYDAGLDLANVWVDGELLDTNVAVFPGAPIALTWGGGQHPPGTLAYANWNEVSLRAIPEPSSVALLCLGGLFLVFRASRRR